MPPKISNKELLKCDKCDMKFDNFKSLGYHKSCLVKDLNWHFMKRHAEVLKTKSPNEAKPQKNASKNVAKKISPKLDNGKNIPKKIEEFKIEKEENKPTNFVLSCLNCNFKSCQPQEITEHYKNNHKKKCDSCDTNFKSHSESQITLHTNKKGQKTYECKSCEFKSCTNLGLIFHNRDKHNLIMLKDVNCQICEKDFYEEEELESHIQQIHGKNQLNE